jgi:hypothetical protein
MIRVVSSCAFEKLDGTFVLFRFGTSLECPEIPALPRVSIFLSRIKAVLTGF